MKDNNNSLAVPNLNIPPEAVEAAARVLHDHAEIFDDVPWQDLSDGDQEAYLDEATAAIRAALAAWPGVGNAAIPHWPGPHQEIEQRPSIILPLTEPRDA